MQQRTIGQFTVSALGLGCMNLSHGYDAPPPFDTAKSLLLRALDLGVTHFDTAALYGFGANEILLGEVLSPHRSKIMLATKGGMHGVDGKRVIDGSPAAIKRGCEQSLQRLRTDVIDLYYLHRADKQVPIEDSIGAMAELVREGKIRMLGLSEVSAQTLQRAHAVHAVAAVQSEYSLWTRNPEIAVLETCREIGASFVAFSPLGRGWLTGKLRDVEHLVAKDIRYTMPRFQRNNFAANQPLLEEYMGIAAELDCEPAQLALAWLMTQDADIIPIPGTRSIKHLEEDLFADALKLSMDTVSRLNALFAPGNVSGDRYPSITQMEIDTENF